MLSFTPSPRLDYTRIPIIKYSLFLFPKNLCDCSISLNIIICICSITFITCRWCQYTSMMTTVITVATFFGKAFFFLSLPPLSSISDVIIVEIKSKCDFCVRIMMSFNWLYHHIYHSNLLNHILESHILLPHIIITVIIT